MTTSHLPFTPITPTEHDMPNADWHQLDDMAHTSTHPLTESIRTSQHQSHSDALVAPILPADSFSTPTSPPAPGTLPIASAELEAAAARLRPDPAIHKALTRLLEGNWSYQTDTGLVVTFDARSRGRKGKPARPYTTTLDSCTCPGAIIRGSCYHQVAWQIVNESLAPTVAFHCTLHSTLFVPLTLLALAANTDRIMLTADSEHGTLTFAVPHHVTATINVDVPSPVRLCIDQHICATDLLRIIDGLQDALSPDGDDLLLEIDGDALMLIAGAVDEPVFVDGLIALPTNAPHDDS